MKKLLASLVLIAAISVSACSESAPEGDPVAANDAAPATKTDQQQAAAPGKAMPGQKQGNKGAAPNMWELSRQMDKKTSAAEGSKESAEEDSDPADENEG
ncbi:MAG: hypothetical protein PVI83_02885 [Lysobacterales bacterium]|jgi:hypothetical protein